MNLVQEQTTLSLNGDARRRGREGERGRYTWWEKQRDKRKGIVDRRQGIGQKEKGDKATRKTCAGIKETNRYLGDENGDINEDGRSVESRKRLYPVLPALPVSPVCSCHGWKELYGASFLMAQIMGKLRLIFLSGPGRSWGPWVKPSLSRK